MHQTKKRNSWCISRGPHVLKLHNVTTNPCPMWPHYISNAIKLRTKLLRSLRLKKRFFFSKMILHHMECQNKYFWRILSSWWPVLPPLLKSQNALKMGFLGPKMGQKWVKNVFFQK